MEIKEYSDKYKSQVQYTCKLTGPDNCFTDEKVGTYIVNTYCNYYIENEPENCFVLVDENDDAQGYILCSSDIKKFKSGFKKYLPIIKANAGKSIKEVYGEFIGTLVFSVAYPAHMHIDINYDYTGHGDGTKMLKRLFEHLKSKNVKGLMLIVGSGNTEAIRFYKRNGFKVLFQGFDGTVMGIKLR